MGWNLIWYVPLCLAVLFVLWSNLHFDWVVFRTARARWVWAALLSPSAALCFSSLIANLLLPFQLVLLIPGLFDPGEPDVYSKRYRYALMAIVGIFVIPLLVEAVVWGSFPFNYDPDGTGRLRLIPFVPWPTNPFGSL